MKHRMKHRLVLLQFLSLLFLGCDGKGPAGPGDSSDPWSFWPGPGERPTKFIDTIFLPDNLLIMDMKWATPHIPGGRAKVGESVNFWADVRNNSDQEIWMSITAVEEREDNPLQPGKPLKVFSGLRGFKPKQIYSEVVFGYYAQEGDGFVNYLRFCFYPGIEYNKGRPPRWCRDTHQKIEWDLS